MAKNSKHQKISPQTEEDAVKAAKATQRPGQTKEQTKLIAQGIQKGIDHYKKQQKAKARELNKKLHKVSQSLTHSANNPDEAVAQESIVHKPALLPWILLIISWGGFAAFYFFVLM